MAIKAGDRQVECERLQVGDLRRQQRQVPLGFLVRAVVGQSQCLHLRGREFLRFRLKRAYIRLADVRRRIGGEIADRQLRAGITRLQFVHDARDQAAHRGQLLGPKELLADGTLLQQSDGDTRLVGEMLRQFLFIRREHTAALSPRDLANSSTSNSSGFSRSSSRIWNQLTAETSTPTPMNTIVTWPASEPALRATTKPATATTSSTNRFTRPFLFILRSI